MPLPPSLVVSGAVEGLVDEAVLRRLLQDVETIPGNIFGKYGKSFLRQNIRRYNQSACHFPWVVLVDLNHEADCAPALCEAWLPNPAPHMCLRVAVREVESWLLADRERLARFLGIAVTRLPRDPEALEDPKRTVIALAAQSRRRDIREDMTPRPGSGRRVGPAYTSRLIEFVADRGSGWRPTVAAENADSLKRCLRRLKGLANA
jgi:hypothetical protein